VDVPDSCDGYSMTGTATRNYFYGEALEGEMAMRMVRNDRYKLIWYPAGNTTHLFDLEADPQETCDLAGNADHADILSRLEQALIGHLYGGDESLTAKGKLTGTKAPIFTTFVNRGFSGQRGHHFPPPPLSDASVVVGTPKLR